MAKFQKSTPVDASPERAWQVVGDLVLMGRLAGANDVRIDGMTRVCTFPNGVVQHEQISNYSQGERSYGYAIEGSPLPVQDNRGALAVVSAGGRTSVVWDAEFEPIDASQADAIGSMWQGAMEQLLKTIKQRIEAEPASP